MRIAQVLSSISRCGAGVMDAVRHSCLGLHPFAGVDTKVFSLIDSYSALDTSLWQPIQPDLFPVAWPQSFGYSPGLKRALGNGGIDLIHSHGLWMHPGLAAHGVSKRQGIPHVVSPHGMLDPLSIKRKWLRKRFFWHTLEKARVKSAAVLHATSLLEAEHFRALRLRNPIAVIPLGVELKEFASARDSKETKAVLFLSRIHPQKGLLNLVQAWAALMPQGWKAIIAGPNQFGHEEEVRAAVRKAGLAEQFEFPGPVYGEAKWSLLRSADLFVLPTFSECFGIAIAEALACGVPVITTKGAPWADLEERKCGWWIDIGVEPLAAALREAMALSDEERLAMGMRGRQLIDVKYAWPGIAKLMLAVYHWVLNGGATPDCVRLD